MNSLYSDWSLLSYFGECNWAKARICNDGGYSTIWLGGTLLEHGTLYGAINRLEERSFIKPLASTER